ncbi:MAG: Maf family nucleotide pyrophosphatase [Magnetococcus sp. DMHC-1]|nr:septum formation inhibitor Maf [Magnetococcales bacterium]
MHLVLASTSLFRRQLLERLGLPFVVSGPGVDETRLPDESPSALVQRLAEAKARAVGPDHPDSLIIGSDQVAEIDGYILGKPETHARAVAQLQQASGRRVAFVTGISLLNTATGRLQTDMVPFHAHFRPLSPPQIERYLLRERPYACAGSFKMEGLGIALFERLEGDDPTALIGLPLIRLVTMLAEEGVDVI